MITITEKASQHLIGLMLDEGLDPNDTYLKVSVVASGCSGLSYKMDFSNKIGSDEEIFESNEIKIISDQKSLLYIWGTELDYSSGLNGKGLVWNNPQASRNCSCGSSFSV